MSNFYCPVSVAVNPALHLTEGLGKKIFEIKKYTVCTLVIRRFGTGHEKIYTILMF